MTALLPTDPASTIFEDAVVKFQEFLTKVQQSQHAILQSEGVGKKWNKAEQVAQHIRSIISRLEDIIMLTLLEPDAVIKAHRTKQLVYQTD